jgi:hypothetical protein
MTDRKKGRKAPPAVLSADPEPGLEQKLKRNPKDPDAKADVGSDTKTRRRCNKSTIHSFPLRCEFLVLRR